jgi:hypothetical protein
MEVVRIVSAVAGAQSFSQPLRSKQTGARLVRAEVQGDIGHEGRWMVGNVWRGWEVGWC